MDSSPVIFVAYCFGYFGWSACREGWLPQGTLSMASASQSKASISIQPKDSAISKRTQGFACHQDP